jgi:hypothetical protein
MSESYSRFALHIYLPYHLVRISTAQVKLENQMLFNTLKGIRESRKAMTLNFCQKYKKTN